MKKITLFPLFFLLCLLAACSWFGPQPQEPGIGITPQPLNLNTQVNVSIPSTTAPAATPNLSPTAVQSSPVPVQIQPTQYNFQGQVVGGTAVSPVLSFNQADYEAVLQTDKLVVLYFYASWCPICQAEIPKFYDALVQLNSDQVIGFRVNFNDSDTDKNEENLAHQFGIAYQHTKVFVQNGQRVLKAPDSWDQARYISEINNFLN